MSNRQFARVWDAIEDTPEEAENMKLRSALMTALKNHLTRTEMNQANQAQAARLFGVTQPRFSEPRISDLMRGKIDLCGLDALVSRDADSEDARACRKRAGIRTSPPR